MHPLGFSLCKNETAPITLYLPMPLSLATHGLQAVNSQGKGKAKEKLGHGLSEYSSGWVRTGKKLSLDARTGPKFEPQRPLQARCMAPPAV